MLAAFGSCVPIKVNCLRIVSYSLLLVRLMCGLVTEKWRDWSRKER